VRLFKLTAIQRLSGLCSTWYAGVQRDPSRCRGEGPGVVTGGTEGCRTTLTLLAHATHEPPCPVVHLVCSMWSRDGSDARCSWCRRQEVALAHQVLGTLHLKAPTDCAIPRGQPLRSSLRRRQQWPTAILYPGAPRWSKEDRWTADLHNFLTSLDVLAGQC